MSRDMVHYMRKLNTFCDTLSSQIRRGNELSGRACLLVLGSYAHDFVRMLCEERMLCKGRMLCEGMILHGEHATQGDAAGLIAYKRFYRLLESLFSAQHRPLTQQSPLVLHHPLA